jgi:hypothetical protein
LPGPSPRYIYSARAVAHKLGFNGGTRLNEVCVPPGPVVLAHALASTARSFFHGTLPFLVSAAHISLLCTVTAARIGLAPLLFLRVRCTRRPQRLLPLFRVRCTLWPSRLPFFTLRPLHASTFILFSLHLSASCLSRSNFRLFSLSALFSPVFGTDGKYLVLLRVRVP